MLTRRALIAAGAFALPSLLPARAQTQVGVTDWNLKKSADITAIAGATVAQHYLGLLAEKKARG